MSLIHWWPLNGNLNDQGILSLNLSGQGSIGFTSSGKIGKGVSFTSDSHSLKATDLSTLTALTKYSMSCWVYLSNRATNHSSSFLSSGNWNAGNAQVCFGLYNYNSGYNTLLVPNKSSWNNGINLTTKIQLGVWHHYAIVYDGSTTKGYIDGTYVGSYSGGGISSTEVSYYYLGAATYYSGFTMKGTMNDFRIYDHALSVKEVKEISKGLVLHYNFEDEYIEPTTNLVTQLVSGGRTFIIDNAIVTNGTNGDTYFHLKFSTALVQGTTYTISCDAEIPTGGTGTQWKFGMGSQSASDPNFIINNGHNEYTFVCTANSAKQQLLLDDMSRIYGVNSRFYNFQVEQKDHATPYANGTRSSGKVYDSSGYGNNGTVIGDCQIISQTNNGIHSLFNNSTNIGTSTSSGAAYIKGTLVNPWSPEQLTISFWAKIIDYRYQNSGILSLSNNSSHPNDYTQAGVHQFDSVFRFVLAETAKNLSTDSLIETNVWHHYVLVYNGSSIISYRDGIKIQEVSGASGNIKLFQYIYLGLNVAGGAWRQSKENWADFKLYSTALSEADIQAEYNRKAAIDKNGNLFTGEFIEQNSVELLPGTHISATGNVYRQSGDPSRLTQDTDGSMVLTNTVWTMTPMFPVNAGETLYWDITYSNTSGNQLYVGFEQFDANGNSGSNELCKYVISGDTSARDHYRVKGTIVVGTTAESGNPITNWRLRVLNAWNGTSATKVAKIHHISLRRILTLNTTKVDKNNFIATNSIREDENYTKVSMYKNGFIGVHEIEEL